jgi:hypothetical protein
MNPRELDEAITEDLRDRFEGFLSRARWPWTRAAQKVGRVLKYHAPATQAAWLGYQEGFMDGYEVREPKTEGEATAGGGDESA